MKSPAVSGAQSYQQACVTAKNEKKRLQELKRRCQYRKSISQRKALEKGVPSSASEKQSTRTILGIPLRDAKRDKPGNLARDCAKSKLDTSERRHTKVRLRSHYIHIAIDLSVMLVTRTADSSQA